VLLAGCGALWPRAGSTHVDYVDFVKFCGITYHAADHRVGRPARRSDLGPVFAQVRRQLPGDKANAQIKDGDAPFLPPGTPVYTVKGYRATFRLAASHDGRLWLYEAHEVPGARTGADLLDLAGKVRYIGINSLVDGSTELTAIRQRTQVARLVQGILNAPVRASRTSDGNDCVIAFHLADGTAVTRAYDPGTGELVPGVFAPREFSRAVTGGLRARHGSCNTRS
jgi:hypothetical protein